MVCGVAVEVVVTFGSGAEHQYVGVLGNVDVNKRKFGKIRCRAVFQNNDSDGFVGTRLACKVARQRKKHCTYLHALSYAFRRVI